MLKELLSGSRSLKTGRGLLLPLLNRYLLTVPEDKRTFPWLVMDMMGDWRDKTPGWFHPSSLAKDFCERRWVIGTHELGDNDDDVEVRPRAEKVRIFAMGHMLHSQIQYWLADMGVLYGRWSCTGPDAHTWWGLPPRSARCPTCQHVAIYRELPIEIRSLQMRGHMDGEITLPEERIGLEVKSCNARFYDSVAAEPYSEHLEQAVWYLYGRSHAEGTPMRALREPRLKYHALPLRRSVILYINKDTSQCREHIVELTPSVIRAIIEPRLDQIEKARRFKPGRLHTLPARICDNEAEGRMRKCPMVDSCFSLPPVPVRPKRKKVRV